MKTLGVLNNIVEDKRAALAKQKSSKPIQDWIRSAQSIKTTSAFNTIFSDSSRLSVIAEMKCKSPSAGVLISNYIPEDWARRYQESGARGLSVLTEEKNFGGSSDHLARVKNICELPILRKDFILDPYQIYESKALGASAILLIIAILPQSLYHELLCCAKEVGISVLVEIHSHREMEMALKEEISLLGINNRNLDTLEVDIQTTFKIFPSIPKSISVISESGIKEPETISDLKKLGVRGALIGESILRSEKPLDKLKSLVDAG